MSHTSTSRSPANPAARQTRRRATESAADDVVLDPELAEYYSKAFFEFGYASMCKMSVPLDLDGLKVLDIGCRRGKGVFKLSARVGNDGHVIGLDWNPAYIAEANQRSERAWMESLLDHNNMEFHVAYPEDLGAIGIEDDSLDLVFVNSVINLAYDYDRAFSEIHRVLKPGGLLICETVLSDRERDPRVVEEARQIGNNVQSAPSKTRFEALMASLGFQQPVYLDANIVEPDAGFKYTYKAPVVQTDEDVVFVASVAHLRK